MFFFLLLNLAALAVSLPTITIKGSKFFTSDGNQWFIKGMCLPLRLQSLTDAGVAYQLVPQDPLVNGTQCALDAALMKTLGTNAIRVYHVDATADHTACMQAFDAAGIYAFIDLDDFDTQINQVRDLRLCSTWLTA